MLDEMGALALYAVALTIFYPWILLLGIVLIDWRLNKMLKIAEAIRHHQAATATTICERCGVQDPVTPSKGQWLCANCSDAGCKAAVAGVR